MEPLHNRARVGEAGSYNSGQLSLTQEVCCTLMSVPSSASQANLPGQFSFGNSLVASTLWSSLQLSVMRMALI